MSSKSYSNLHSMHQNDTETQAKYHLKGDLRIQIGISLHVDLSVETYTNQFSYCVSFKTCWKHDCLLISIQKLTLAAMLCGSLALPCRARGLRFVFKAGPRALPLVLFCTFWCAAALMTSSLLHPSWHFPGMGFLFCRNMWFLLSSICKTNCDQNHQVKRKDLLSYHSQIGRHAIQIILLPNEQQHTRCKKESQFESAGFSAGI